MHLAKETPKLPPRITEKGRQKPVFPKVGGTAEGKLLRLRESSVMSPREGGERCRKASLSKKGRGYKKKGPEPAPWAVSVKKASVFGGALTGGKPHAGSRKSQRNTHPPA